jgi:hypothetical protein
VPDFSETLIVRGIQIGEAAGSRAGNAPVARPVPPAPLSASGCRAWSSAKERWPTGAARKKAIVAVARQLAVELWGICTGRLSAEALELII